MNNLEKDTNMMEYQEKLKHFVEEAKNYRSPLLDLMNTPITKSDGSFTDNKKSLH